MEQSQFLQHSMCEFESKRRDLQSIFVLCIGGIGPSSKRRPDILTNLSMAMSAPEA